MDRSDKPRKRPIALVWGSLAAVILLVWWLTSAGRSQADGRFSTEPVHVAIGLNGYTIPRNYIDFIRYDGDRKPLWVYLKLLWPNLEPLTPDNANLWKSRLPYRQIRAAILQKPEVESYHVFESLIKRGILPLEPTRQQYGLNLYQDSRSRRFVAVDEAAVTPTGFPITFACDDVLPNTRERFDVELICVSKYTLNDGSGLRYFFFEKNLPNWRQIDTSLRALINEFQNKEVP